ncbi:MAG: hypothetical protein U0L66_07850 [Acutalibacteraceae bacterium]|nr:hypothetical protein [Acutalibacteraceae bacterium]
MTPEQLLKLLNYIMENNSWNKLGEVVGNNRNAIKYIDFTLDSRDGRVFSIRFRQGGCDKRFTINCKSDIEHIYEWLDRPLR